MLYSKKSSGFTLIELLIVIAILGFLMSVVLVLIKPQDILDRSKTKAAGNLAGKICGAIQVCHVKDTVDGVCDAPGNLKPSANPSGIKSVAIGTTTPFTVTVKSTMSGGSDCSVTCSPADGEVVYGASCVQ